MGGSTTVNLHGNGKYNTVSRVQQHITAEARINSQYHSLTHSLSLSPPSRFPIPRRYSSPPITIPKSPPPRRSNHHHHRAPAPALSTTYNTTQGRGGGSAAMHMQCSALQSTGCHVCATWVLQCQFPGERGRTETCLGGGGMELLWGGCSVQALAHDGVWVVGVRRAEQVGW